MYGGHESLQSSSFGCVAVKTIRIDGHSTINLHITYLIFHSDVGFKTIRTIDSGEKSMIPTISWLEMPGLTNGKCQRGDFGSISPRHPLHLASDSSNLQLPSPMHHLPNTLYVDVKQSLDCHVVQSVGVPAMVERPFHRSKVVEDDSARFWPSWTFI